MLKFIKNLNKSMVEIYLQTAYLHNNMHDMNIFLYNTRITVT